MAQPAGGWHPLAFLVAFAQWSRTNFSECVFHVFQTTKFLSAGHQLRASIIRKELVCYATASVHALTTRKMFLTIAVISIYLSACFASCLVARRASRRAIELLQF